MEYVPVQSSHIEAVGYDADLRTLAVRFIGGKLLIVPGVTATEHGALMTAPSKGRWLAEFRRRRGETAAKPAKPAKTPPDCSFGVVRD